jgi:hypothetical protein
MSNTDDTHHENQLRSGVRNPSLARAATRWRQLRVPGLSHHSLSAFAAFFTTRHDCPVASRPFGLIERSIGPRKDLVG